MIKQKTKNMHDLTSWAARLTLKATSIPYLEPHVLLRVTGGWGRYWAVAGYAIPPYNHRQLKETC